MTILWFILAGLAGGVLAGMGMGGGTFLIPILTILLLVPQNAAQGINLIVFLPMSIIVIVIYICKKMIDFKGWWLISIPACIVAGIGAFFALKMPAKILKITFGSFIVIIGIIQIVLLIIEMVKKNNVNKI